MPSPLSAPQLDDATLVARARGGDMGAFETLFHRHAGRVMAVCVRMADDAAEARECAHDAFVRAWERLGSFRGEAAFTTWLHRLTVNVVLERARGERRRHQRVALAGDEADDPTATAAAPALVDVGLRLDLERAITRLPTQARHVFVLHDIEGFRHDEIAERMALAPGTVRAHLHRARTLLATWLDR